MFPDNLRISAFLVLKWSPNLLSSPQQYENSVSFLLNKSIIFIYFLFSSEDMLIDFTERAREGEGEVEKH